MSILLLKLISDKYTLWTIAKLNKRLQNAAPIMLVTGLSVFGTDSLDALLYNLVFLLVADFFLFHQKPVVGDLDKVKVRG